MSEAIVQTALAFKKAGIFPLRVKEDGSKAPWVSTWKNLKGLPTDEEIYNTFSGAKGVGILTGRVSGNLEMLEFEGRAVQEGMLLEADNRCDASKLGPLWKKLKNGYSEKTPSGGFHLLFFVSDGAVPGNTKIAERAASKDEFTPREQEVHAAKPEKVFRRTLIETRGDGGFVVTAPTEGALHKSGKPWQIMSGGPKSIPTITVRERNKLVEVLQTLDKVPKSKLTRSVRAGVPETEWEKATSWGEILVPHGWDLDSENSGIQYWRHSGHASGHSATIGAGRVPDRFYVFSTSTEFEEGRYYSKAEAYAVLNNEGNAEAAREELQLRARKPTVVVIGRDESELIDEIASIMTEVNSTDPTWFEYGNQYVEISNGAVLAMTDETVGYLASTAMRFLTDPEKETIAAPPSRVLTGMISGHRLRLPSLRKVSRIPFFTRSGKLWTTPGYCEEAQMYYEPEFSIPAIPPTPSDDLVLKAISRIRKHIELFPFDKPSDESVWWSLLFHSFVRDMIHGPTPLHLFAAPTPGTGKSLCAQVALHIAHGNSVAQSWPKDTHMEAVIMTNLMTGKPFVFFDNAYSIQHGAFDAVLTAYPNYSGRLLGGNVFRDLPNFAAYVVSSNNPDLGEEELRRSVLSKLDAKMEDPGDRQISVPVLFNVEQERRELIISALIIIQKWIGEGMPVGKQKLASFEQWSEVMGGICASMGLPSPVGDRKAMKDELTNVGSAWKAFVQKWAIKLESPVFKANFAEPNATVLLTLCEELDLPIKGFDDTGKARSLGHLLAKKKGQVIAGYLLSCRSLGGSTRYKLTKAVSDVELPSPAVLNARFVGDTDTNDPQADNTEVGSGF